MMKKGIRKFFGTRPCEICGAMITNNKRGRSSHMRAHVRDNEAIEQEKAGGLYWRKIEKPTCVLCRRTVSKEFSAK
jgi:hypothetical protein